MHIRPRTALFIPSEVQYSPNIFLEDITGVRTTRHQWAGTTEVHEAQGDFTGTTARLELGEPWANETLFKLHPSQTRGRYDGLLAEDYSPLEPPGTAIQLRPLPSPKEPAPSERELHNLTHLQHRRWCPACVSAKADESPRDQHKDKLPAIQIDYMFVSTKGAHGESEGTDDAHAHRRSQSAWHSTNPTP